jgi:hypothetical protein
MIPTMTIEEFNKKYGTMPEINMDSREPIATRGFATSLAVSGGVPQQQGTMQGFSQGVAKSGLSTLQNLGNMVLSPVKSALGLQGVKTGLSEETLKPQTRAEETGKLVGDIAQYFVPSTRIAKATQGLSFLPKVLSRTAGDVGVAGIQSGGDTGEMKTVGAISAGIQSISPIVRMLSSIGKRTLATVSGKGTEVIEQALKTPEATRQGLRLPALQSLKDDVSNVITQVKDLARASTQNYGKALEELPKRLGRSPEVITAGQKTTIKVGGQTYTLSMQGIKSSLTRTLRDFGVEVNPKKKTLDFLQTTLDSGEEKRLREVFTVINKWKDTTPQGLNTLATKIGNFKKPTEQSKQLNAMIGKIKNNVRDYIGDRVPAVKELNKRFMQEQRFLDELDTYLRTSNGFNTADTVKNVANRIQKLFVKDKEMAREVLENLAGGAEIAGRQAGRELQSAIPRSTATIGDKISGIIQSILPPKVIGEIITTTGIAKNQLQSILQTGLSKLPEEQAVSLLNMLKNSDTLTRITIINLMKGED